MYNTNVCCQSDPLTHLVFNQIKTMGQETVEFWRAGTRPYVDHYYSYQVTLYQHIKEWKCSFMYN